MADEAKNEEKQPEAAPKKKGFNFKIILIGLPLFIVQLVLVYFLTATFLIKTAPAHGEETNSEHVEDGEEHDEDDEDEEDEDGEHGGSKVAQHIYTIEDLIINPAGTSGQRLLLLSVGFGVKDEEKAALLQENEIVIKDMILHTVSQKSLRTLSKVELKDSLKHEIAESVNKAIPKAKIKSVYFSKYVLN